MVSRLPKVLRVLPTLPSTSLTSQYKDWPECNLGTNIHEFCVGHRPAGRNKRLPKGQRAIVLANCRPLTNDSDPLKDAVEELTPVIGSGCFNLMVAFLTDNSRDRAQCNAQLAARAPGISTSLIHFLSSRQTRDPIGRVRPYLTLLSPGLWRVFSSPISVRAASSGCPFAFERFMGCGGGGISPSGRKTSWSPKVSRGSVHFFR